MGVSRSPWSTTWDAHVARPCAVVPLVSAAAGTDKGDQVFCCPWLQAIPVLLQRQPGGCSMPEPEGS